MRNRSKTLLPSQFEPALVNWLETPVGNPQPLEVYQITCLHFHSHVELRTERVDVAAKEMC